MRDAVEEVVWHMLPPAHAQAARPMLEMLLLEVSDGRTGNSMQYQPKKPSFCTYNVGSQVSNYPRYLR